MSATDEFIKRIEALQNGERSRLRRLAGQPLGSTLQGFDLFTGLWWPLREVSPRAPRRETSWLVTKLLGSFPVPAIRRDCGFGPTLPSVLGLCEPRDEVKRSPFRRRFDALLCSPLATLEPHLCWALGQIAHAVNGPTARVGEVKGINWATLLDDLSLWDRGYNTGDTQQRGRIRTHNEDVHCGESHERPQELWACEYLYAANLQN